MEYLQIGEFAEAIGVTIDTLRSWDKQGVFKPHHRTPGGQRVYSSEQIEMYFLKFSDTEDFYNGD